MARVLGVFVGVAIWSLIFQHTEQTWLKIVCGAAALYIVIYNARQVIREHRGDTPP